MRRFTESKIILLLILCTLCNYAVLGQSDTVNQVDQLDRKQGYWVYYGKDRPTAGYPADGKIEEGRYLDNRKIGFWSKYFEDGKTLKLKGSYVNNRPRGLYWKYWQNGNLRESGLFFNGKYRGIRTSYYEDGSIYMIQHYSENGEEIGTTETYFMNGCLKSHLHFDTIGVLLHSIKFHPDSCNVPLDTVQHQKTVCTLGTKDSIEMIYAPVNVETNHQQQRTASIRTSKLYFSSYSDSCLCQSLHETGRKLNSEKEIMFEGRCFEGRLWEGKLFFYDSDGILFRIEAWKEGIYIGPGRL